MAEILYVEKQNTVVQKGKSEVAVKTQTVYERVEVSKTGPQGPAGPPGTAGSETFYRAAGEAISALTVLIEKDEKVYACDPSSDECHLICGIAITAGQPDALIEIRRYGAMEDSSWNWSSDLVFVGADGKLTETPPTTGYEILFGTTPSSKWLNIDIDNPLQLI